MQFSYKTIGSCASQIDVEIEDGLIVSADFIDGCAGNTQAIAALVKGMAVDEAVRRLKGIACQGETSCPDQLARALEAANAARLMEVSLKVRGESMRVNDEFSAIEDAPDA